MANITGASFGECRAISKPPMLDNINFIYWKCRMKVFVQSMDVECHQEGTTCITMKNPSAYGTCSISWCFKANCNPTPCSRIPEEHTRQLTLIAQVIHRLYCALSPSKFNGVSSYATVKEILDRVESHMRAHIKSERQRWAICQATPKCSWEARWKHHPYVYTLHIHCKLVLPAREELGKCRKCQQATPRPT